MFKNETKIKISVLQNKNLSLKAKGVYACICMIGEINDLFQLYQLSSQSNDALISGINELIENNLFKGVNNNKNCLYVVSDGNENYKIGITKDMLSRNKQFSNHLPFHEVLYTHYCENYKQLEKLFHEKFKSKNIRNEWFRLNTSDLYYIDYFCRGEF